MVVKKFKKQKAEGSNFGSALGSNANMTIKDPFYYNEEVYYPSTDAKQRSYVYVLADLSNIVPFGFITEQFLRDLK
jgi:hypothetical protein